MSFPQIQIPERDFIREVMRRNPQDSGSVAHSIAMARGDINLRLYDQAEYDTGRRLAELRPRQPSDALVDIGERLLEGMTNQGGVKYLTSIADVPQIPAYSKQIVRETVYQQVAAAFADFSSKTKFEEKASSVEFFTIGVDRDAPGAQKNAWVRYEGRGIENIGIKADSERVYLRPCKLGWGYSDELMKIFDAFFGQGQLEAEFVLTLSGELAKIYDTALMDELTRSADAYGAALVSNEDLSGNFDGTKTRFPLAGFPVVRPYQARNLAGVTIGQPENPITATYQPLGGDAVTLADVDDPMRPAQDFYYRLAADSGMLQITDATGNAIAPESGDGLVISYYKATNCKFLNL